MGTQRKRSIRRLVGGGVAIGLIVGLAACDVSLDGRHSGVEITRTCRGEPDHLGSSAVRTQVIVTVDEDETEHHHILVSLNDGEQTAGQADVAPGSGLALLDNEVNTEVIDVAVVPSDATGPFDTYHQVFNAC
ncbi:MAG TPA: hypothetical protein VGO60_18370 [Iamia sp.]|jgi:hypothetical protein|nr:hypothetical protein [Iamia sp.]